MSRRLYVCSCGFRTRWAWRIHKRTGGSLVTLGGPENGKVRYKHEHPAKGPRKIPTERGV